MLNPKAYLVYDSIEEKYGFYIATIKDKSCLIDEDGNKISGMYDSLYPAFDGKLLRGRENGQARLLSTEGIEVVGEQHEVVKVDFKQNVIVCQNRIDRLLGVLDFNKNEIIPFKYTWIRITNNTGFLCKGKRSIDTYGMDGNILTNIEYKKYNNSELHYHIIALGNNDKFGIIDTKNGKQVLDFKYDKIDIVYNKDKYRNEYRCKNGNRYEYMSVLELN